MSDREEPNSDPDQPNEENPSPGAPSDDPGSKRRRQWESIRVLLLYGACIGGLFGLRYVPFVQTEILDPYTSFVAWSASSIIDFFSEVERDGLVLSGPHFSLVIMEECNGVAALLIFLAAVLAHHVSWKFKLLGIALGVPAIYAFNLIRVISLFYLRWHWPALFDLMHLYVWQALVIFFAIFTWLYWAGLCGPGSNAPREEAPSV